MKIVLDIKDSKAEYILDWLKQFTYVKITAEKKSKKASNKLLVPTSVIKKAAEKQKINEPNKIQ